MIGCILSFIASAIGSVAGFYLIQNTEIQDQYWLSFGYGCLCVLAFVNLWGIVQAWQKKRSFGLPRSSWKDGNMVGVTGKIRALKAPIMAPFSKQEAVMVDYSIMFPRGIDSPSDNRLCFGIMRTPCAVEFEGQSYKIQGMPVLTELKVQVLSPQTSFPAALEFVSAAEYQPMLNDPTEVDRAVSAAYKDSDGDIQTHFAVPDYKLLVVDKMKAQAGDNLRGLNPFRGFLLEERFVPHDAEVSINGTFLASQNVIDIGGGVNKPTHSLKIGHGASRSNWPIIKASILAFIFTSAFVVATYVLAMLPRN